MALSIGRVLSLNIHTWVCANARGWVICAAVVNIKDLHGKGK